MPKKYRSGFERLSQYWDFSEQRYAVALAAVKENFSGFTKKAGFIPGKMTEAQKRQVRRYYNTLTEYTEGGPVYKMTPSELPKAITKGGRKNVEQVMKAAQMPHGRKRAKYIFIKYDGETIPKVKIRNNVPVFVNDKFGTEKEVIELDKQSLAIDPVGTIKSIAPYVEGAKFFRIINGRHEFYGAKGTYSAAADLNTLANAVVELQQKYAIGTKDSWDRWLHGIAVYYVKTKDFGTVVQHQADTRRAFRERIKKESAKVRRKRQRGK